MVDYYSKYHEDTAWHSGTFCKDKIQVCLCEKWDFLAKYLPASGSLCCRAETFKTFVGYLTVAIIELYDQWQNWHTV